MFNLGLDSVDYKNLEEFEKANTKFNKYRVSKIRRRIRGFFRVPLGTFFNFNFDKYYYSWFFFKQQTNWFRFIRNNSFHLDVFSY